VKVGVALAIALERRARAVMAPAVELGDQPVVRPQRIHLVAGDDRVGERPHDAVAVAQGDERRLEVAAGMRRPAREQSLQGSRTRPPRADGEHRRDVEQAAVLGGLDRPGERRGADRSGEVGERARDVRDRDAVDVRDLVAREVARAVHADAVALPAALAHHGHVDAPARSRAEVPQRGRVRVAEHRSVPDRPHRREPPSFLRQPPVPVRVHPAVNGHEPPAHEPAADLPLRRTERIEPTGVQDPVVEVGERPHPLIECLLRHINTHAVFMCGRAGVRPPVRPSCT
jgi:hypothetical protein